MENIILITIVICAFFVIVKMIEMRITEEEIKPLKNIVRETFIVAGCAFLPIWGYFQFKDKISDWFGVEPIGGKDILKSPEIFTDTPGF